MHYPNAGPLEQRFQLSRREQAYPFLQTSAVGELHDLANKAPVARQAPLAGATRPDRSWAGHQRTPHGRGVKKVEYEPTALTHCRGHLLQGDDMFVVVLEIAEAG